MRRSITSIRLQVAFAGEHGVAAERCLDGSGLTPADLLAGDREVDAEQELIVIGNLCRRLGAGASLGLAMGQRYSLSSYGAWGFALLSSPTFRQAIDLGLRYLDLTFAFCRFSLQETAEQVSLNIDDSLLPPSVHDYLLARDVSAVMVIQQELFATRIPLAYLSLNLPALGDNEYEHIFGVTPTLQSPQNQATFAANLLDMSLPQANPVTARLCEQQCRQLLASRQRRAGVAGQVREILLATPGQFAAMDAMASELGITGRTLRRRLQAEGTGYRELLDEVRLLLAEQWLQDGLLNQEEISERLGYSEVSNFIHAFKRWTGQTPARYRRRYS
ncbi:MAG: AraC family transcriptional regulator [Alcanivorax sp.]|nr:AraC family transcriptional regulator [Alcanivorax sp.]